MSIAKISTPALPLALGLLLSAGLTLQPNAALAQGAADDASGGVSIQPAIAQTTTVTSSQGRPAGSRAEVGGVEVLFNGDDIDVAEFAPQFAAMLPPPGSDAFHMGPGGGGGGGHEGGWHHGPFSEANKLSDDQLERLYAIKEDQKDQLGGKMVQEHSLSRRLKDVLSASSIDSAAAHDLQSKISALKADISNTRIEGLIKMANVLTPEQRHDLRMHMIRAALGHHGHGHGDHSSHGHHEMMGK